ncbi:MAG: hypothetical protein IAF38_03010 [Bacteroidia bacterium]|nr:hypothetical protein [Bacteroidia bacterium]
MKLLINETCHESWDKMKTHGDKRFCDSCTKFVHDFTDYSDEMLIDFFKNHQKENVCGRMRKTQLDRKLIFTRRIKSRFNRFWAATIGIFAFLKNSYSQNTTVKNECGVEMNLIQNKKDTAKIVDGKIFEGWVLEKGTEHNVPHCKISIDGIENSFTADEFGMFCIVLPDSLIKKNLTVRFEARDFAGDTIEIDFHKFQRADVIVHLERTVFRKIMSCEVQHIGGLVAVSYDEKNIFDFSTNFFNLPQRGFNVIRDIKDRIRESKAR